MILKPCLQGFFYMLKNILFIFEMCIFTHTKYEVENE